MKLITRDTDYAVRALCFIAGHKKEIISVSELVRKLKMPRAFLRKTLQVLNKKGLLKSYKGQGGGFALAFAPEIISLVDLVEIFQGPFELDRCIFKKKICPNTKTCKLKKKLDNIQKYIISELKDITLTSLLEGRRTDGEKKDNKNKRRKV